jgi:serine protease Do
MRTMRTWHRASLLIALSLVTASAAAFAASGNPVQRAVTPSRIIIGFSGSHDHWLGLVVQDVNEAKAQELKLPGVYGAIVVSVISGSPAEKAGFQKNDVIMEFDGQRVRSAAQLHRLVKETPPGRTVSTQISRQGKLQTLQAKIENRGPSASLETPDNPKYRFWIGPEYEMPQSPEPQPFLEPVPKGKIIPLPPVMPKFYLGPLPNLKPQPLPQPKPFIEPGPWEKIIPSPPAKPFNGPYSLQQYELGISGDDLTPQLARFFGVKQGKGVLISRVDPHSPASEAGLKAGDVIVRVGSQEVGSMAELRRALRTQANKQHRVTLGIVRNHQEREMSVLLIPDRSAPYRHGVKPEPIMALRHE